MGNAVTSTYSNMKYGKNLAADFKNLPAHFYEFSAAPLMGDKTPIKMADFKNKVVLVVNIASQCGYTASNNKMIAALAKKHEARTDFVILAFPCDQFGGQEYSDPIKICDAHMNGLKDCKTCIGKNLLLMDKIDVNGDSADMLFKYLRLNSSLFSPASGAVSPIPWNYCKFLIDKEGSVKQYFKSGDMKEVETAVDQLLA